MSALSFSIRSRSGSAKGIGAAAIRGVLRVRDSVLHGRVAWLLVATLIWIVLSGCAVIPRFGDPDLAGPPPPSPEDASQAGPGGDPVRVPDPDTWSRVPADSPTTSPMFRSGEKIRPPVAGTDSSGMTADAPADSSIAVPSTAPGDSLSTDAAPVVTISIPEGELRELEVEARSELIEARVLLRSMDEETTLRLDQEQLRTVEGFIHQAKTALEQSDIPAAARLAHKARVLALELVSQ